jgi:hypothetical protein
MRDTECGIPNAEHRIQIKEYGTRKPASIAVDRFYTKKLIAGPLRLAKP